MFVTWRRTLPQSPRESSSRKDSIHNGEFQIPGQPRVAERNTQTGKELAVLAYNLAIILSLFEPLCWSLNRVVLLLPLVGMSLFLSFAD